MRRFGGSFRRIILCCIQRYASTRIRRSANCVDIRRIRKVNYSADPRERQIVLIRGSAIYGKTRRVSRFGGSVWRIRRIFVSFVSIQRSAGTRIRHLRRHSADPQITWFGGSAPLFTPRSTARIRGSANYGNPIVSNILVLPEFIKTCFNVFMVGEATT